MSEVPGTHQGGGTQERRRATELLRQADREVRAIGKGRRIIGWTEIMEGGLAPEATVQSWLDAKHAVEAAKQGTRCRHVDEQKLLSQLPRARHRKVLRLRADAAGVVVREGQTHPGIGALSLGLPTAPARRVGLSAALCICRSRLVTERRPRLGRFQSSSRDPRETPGRTWNQLPPRPGDLGGPLEMKQEGWYPYFDPAAATTRTLAIVTSRTCCGPEATVTASPVMS